MSLCEHRIPGKHAQPWAVDTRPLVIGRRRSTADVCLILEGTYPYVTGGVSVWVQRLLTGLPNLTFAIVHLSAGRESRREIRYPLPPNLVEFVEWPLDSGGWKGEKGKMERGKWTEDGGSGECPTSNLQPPPSIFQPPFSIFHSPFSPFHAPLPEARVYHALSTGFAGLVGCQVKAATGKPLILTEHGIYWREAEAGAGELECGFRIMSTGEDGICLQLLRRHWTTTLQDLARQAYREADIITTVCEANRSWQLALGAPPSRCHVVHNGVNWQALAPEKPRTPAVDGVYRIGFVGRVVSIKDVATFLYACRRVADSLPKAEFYVIGPLDHDPMYAARCQNLVHRLGLADRIAFTGETNTQPWYHRLDVVVLTSVSEGQPLALLEAMAAGTPVVATAVGGCPELVLGATAADRALEAAGLLTPVGNPQATANAILALCRDRERWQRASQAGQARVRRFYDLKRMCETYRALYVSVISER